MSMIQFSCPSCNAHYKVPKKASGKQATCKSCGGTMTVPSTSQGTGTGAGDLSGLYAGGGGDQVVAPPMQAGSVFATNSQRRGGPSPTLLIAIGGGVFVLILVVVLVVVLMGMGGGDKPVTPVATTGGTPTTDRGRGGTGTRGTTPAGTNNRGENGEGNGETGGPDGTDDVPAGRAIDTPSDALTGVRDWTLDVPTRIENAVRGAEFRGMVFVLPPGWESQTHMISDLMSGNDELANTLTEAFGNEAMETAFFQAMPRESLIEFGFGVVVSRDGSPPAWPQLTEVDRFTNSMQLNTAELAQLDSDGGASSSIIEALSAARDQSPFAFNFFKPSDFYLKRGTYDRVRFGTLFGGYPFARVVMENEAAQTQVLIYTGFVADMQVTFVAQAPAQYSELIEDLDWIIRSARLMSPREANEYGRSDTVYKQWMDNRFVDVAYAGDNAPHPGLAAEDWDGFSERSVFQNAAISTTVSPYRQPYGIVAPEGMRLASVNRLAARWHPDNNGMWLQLKVTKLEGHAQRSMDSPVLTASGELPERLFVHSTEMVLPAGYEVSEIQAGEITLQRVLLPVGPGSNLRKVYYVLFDGASQVTIEGHFDAARPEDLERLDAAAQSLTKI